GRDGLVLLRLAAELGREHDVLAPVPERLAQAALRAADGAIAVAIGVRGIEERDAEVEGPVHHRARRFGIDASTQAVASQADHRHGNGRLSQRALFHWWPHCARSAASIMADGIIGVPSCVPGGRAIGYAPRAP